jgi:hypothetical protein
VDIREVTALQRFHVEARTHKFLAFSPCHCRAAGGAGIAKGHTLAREAAQYHPLDGKSFASLFSKKPIKKTSCDPHFA